MSTIRLDGCTSQPLLSYLSALGVLAAVGEQLDSGVSGWWEHGRFHLDLPSGGDLDSLVEFLARSYAPPPIISPWNSRGGFRLDRLQTSEQRLAELEESTDPRLARYRQAIAAGRQVLTEAEELGMATGGKLDEKHKPEFVRLCRSQLPDDALAWLDAAVVLVDEDARYPELLGGTGGNLGSGDISSNAHEAALWLVRHRDPTPYAREVLSGEGASKLTKLLVGQFHPGGAGGVNMGPSDSMVNPLGYLLALHGATLFATGVARRLDGARVPSIPFTVRVDPGTEQSLAEGEQVRAELWLPEWRRPLNLPELRVLLAEGRAQWSGTQSTRSLDFARAAASLGVDRDITAFNRYLVAQRHGQASLAVSVGRFKVERRRGIELTAAIDDPFLDSVRRLGSRASHEVQRTANLVRRHMFRLAEHGERDDARRTLSALYDLERAIGRSRSAQEAVRFPVRGLLAQDWLELLDDGSPEFRAACAIASQRDRWAPERGRLAMEAGTMTTLLRPVERDGLRRIRSGGDSILTDSLVWSEHSSVVDLTRPDFRHAMREGWHERSIRCAQHPAERPEDELHTPGVPVAFEFAVTCPIDDVISFGEGVTDEALLGEWLRALVMLDWSRTRGSPAPERNELSDGVVLGPTFGTIVPFFSRHAVRIDSEEEDGDRREVIFHPDSDLVAAVTRGDTTTAVRLATRRLRQFGVDVLVPRWISADTRPLDAALVPMSPRDLRRAVRSISPQFPSPFATESEESA
ncbi:MAG: type I-U CRISPR-associated protein Csx17 [Acidimicrobiales bacterium]